MSINWLGTNPCCEINLCFDGYGYGDSYKVKERNPPYSTTVDISQALVDDDDCFVENFQKAIEKSEHQIIDNYLAGLSEAYFNNLSKYKWDYLSEINLPDDFIRKYADKLDWPYLSYNNTRLSEKTLIDHCDKVDWLQLSSSLLKLSDKFILDNINRFDVHTLCLNRELSKDLIDAIRAKRPDLNSDIDAALSLREGDYEVDDWDDDDEDENEPTEELPAGVGSEPASISSILKQAAYRAGSKNIARFIKQQIVSTLPENHSIRKIMDTEYGTAMVMLLAGLTIKHNEISQELKIGSAEIVFNSAYEDIVAAVSNVGILSQVTATLDLLPVEKKCLT